MAAFRHSAYVRLKPDAVICLCSAHLPPGPLNLLCPLPASVFAGLRPGAPVVVDDAGLHVQGHALDLDGAVEWHPPELPDRDRWCPDGQRRAVLLHMLEHHELTEGFGPLLRPLCTDWTKLEVADEGDLGLMKAAVPAIGHLLAWLSDSIAAAPPPDVDGLIGLGPGLTPSGDDFLCGMLVALHGLERKAIANRLAETVSEAAAGTNLISRAHLSCACEGLGSQAIHEAICGLLTCDAARLDRAISALGKTGHSSGWDGLCGVVATLAVLAPSPAR